MAGRIPVFLTGPAAATRAFIDRLGPRLAAPVVHIACDEGVALGELNLAGTVVLYDVDKLAIADQRSVLKWLEAVSGRIQVVSTSSRPVVPLIVSRGFLDTLYYRLNAVYFALPAAHPRGTQLLAQ
jgi:transcriptional regulator of aromatic amino acid metabolism